MANFKTIPSDLSMPDPHDYPRSRYFNIEREEYIREVVLRLSIADYPPSEMHSSYPTEQMQKDEVFYQIMQSKEYQWLVMNNVYTKIRSDTEMLYNSTRYSVEAAFTPKQHELWKQHMMWDKLQGK